LRTRCVVIARRTHLLGALELVVGGEGDGEEVLVRVDKGVDDRGDGGDADGEGDGGDGADARGELGEEGALLNVEDRRGEDGAVVVDLDDGHTVGEGRDVEHVEQRRLGGTDLVAGRHDLDVVDDLDGTTRDLGRDTERLEEGRLSGLHAGVAGRDEHVVGRDVKTKPMLPLMKGRTFSNWGNSPRKPRTARRTIVFLPMRTTPLPRSDTRIMCSCCDETLSMLTMKMEAAE
jgi:hypothetical protein